MAQTLDAILAEAMAGVALGAGIPLPTGTRIFVDSVTGSDDADKGKSPDDPVATLNFASSLGNANKGDVIFLMPGHAETVATPGAININKAGQAVIGLGSGLDRPRFTFLGVVGADIDISQDGILLANIDFENQEDNATGPIDVNAANCTIFNCRFIDNTTSRTLDWIVFDAAADDLKVIDCEMQGTTTAGNQAWLTAVGAADHLLVRRCRVHGDFAVACIDLHDYACTNICIEGKCKLRNANATSNKCIQGHASMSGDIDDCRCRNATDANTDWIDTPGLAEQRWRNRHPHRHAERLGGKR
ncbi:MAG: hypothetical protein AMS14_10865 [Planctomycetes bacterium DG_20]|nr:MAG: hypothetical protein AMS14_10865 [Planctomycetes bacterium DG_20]